MCTLSIKNSYSSRKLLSVPFNITHFTLSDLPWHSVKEKLIKYEIILLAKPVKWFSLLYYIILLQKSFSQPGKACQNFASSSFLLMDINL